MTADDTVTEAEKRVAWHQGWRAGWDDRERRDTDFAAYVREGSTPCPYQREVTDR